MCSPTTSWPMAPLPGKALTAPTFAAETDGFRIQLAEGTARPAEESQLDFAVTRNGRPTQEVS